MKSIDKSETVGYNIGMKFIHMADAHLGSKMEAKLPGEKAKIRRAEIRATFLRSVEYAYKTGAQVYVIAGDLFDMDKPLKKDKEFFYDTVKRFPSIDFLYLRGNHDDALDGENLPNLKTFSKEWTYYRYGKVVFAGIELSGENSLSLYSSLRLGEDDINVVIMHGDISEGAGEDKIKLPLLKDKNIDYLALGHIHRSYAKSLGSRGIARYSGCLEGRGFDETGEKGFYEVTVDENEKRLDSEFTSLSARTVYRYEIDVSSAENPSDVYSLVKSSVKAKSGDLIRVELVGEREYADENVAEDVEAYLKDSYFFVSVKDKTVKKYYAKDFAGDKSLRGEFVRQVLASDLSEEKKSEIIALGLKALSGREVD